MKEDLPIPDDLIRIDDYRVDCLLSDSSAGQSKVFLVNKQGQRYAIKVHLKESYFKEEVGFLEKMDSRYVVKMVCYLEAAKLLRNNGNVQRWPCIILEYVEKGDLSQYWRVARKFTPPVCRTLFKWILLAVRDIHAKGITHRDLKLQNFIFDHNYVLKIVDFGFSTSSEGPEGNGRLTEGKGTDIYWAPEVHKRSYRGLDRDIFAAVIILFLLYTGYPPFTNTLLQNQKYKFLKDGVPGDCQKYWEMVSKNINNVPPQLKQLFEKSFIEDPEKRLTLDQLLSHPWVTSDAASEQQIFNELSLVYEKLKLKDERIQEVSRIKMELEHEICKPEPVYNVRSLEDCTSISAQFVTKYQACKEIQSKMVQLPWKTSRFESPLFQIELPFVVAWVHSFFVRGEKQGFSLLSKEINEVRLKLCDFDVDQEHGRVLVNLCLYIQESAEVLELQGQLYRSTNGLNTWGISWRSVGDCRFWAEEVIAAVETNLKELASSLCKKP